MQMKEVLFRKIRARKLRAHRLQLLWSEVKCLEIGEAPVGLAQTRLHFDAFTVSGDTVLLASLGLERMAVTHPDLGLLRIAGENGLVDLDRLLVVANSRQDRRLQTLVAWVARFERKQGLGFAQRGCGLVLPDRKSVV